jgi:hypothetical protein
MRPFFLLASVVLVIAGCTSAGGRWPENWTKQLDTPDPVESRFPEEVSIIRLIANPQEYDGRYVRVLGDLRG